MANWELKYYYTFKDIDNQNYTVQIYEDIPEPPIPIPLQVRGDYNPCIINYNNTFMFNPVCGSGAELSLLSTSDRMFFNLYTDNMMKYQVRVYKTVWITPIYSVQSPVWFGFLDSENYSEDFSALSNYSVHITANDGFNLLDRMNYQEDETTRYTGIKSHWRTILTILRKLDLPYNYVYVGISTTPLEGVLADYLTIFHKNYNNNANWYNEDNEPETCRTVLENILKPYGAFIIQKEGNLYITDINHIANPTASFKKYLYDSSLISELEYISTDTINLNLGDITSIGVQSSNIQFSVESGINKQVVSYNPYQQSEIFKHNTEDDFEDKSIDSYTTKGTSPYRWNESVLNSSDLFNSFNDAKFCKLQGIDPINQDIKDYYLKIPNRGLIGYGLVESPSTLSFSVKSQLPVLIPSEKYYLKLEMKVYFRTLLDLNNQEEEITKGIGKGELLCKLQIGTEKAAFNYLNLNHSWVDINDTTGLLKLYFEDIVSPIENYPINDKWIELKITRPIYLGDAKWKKEELPWLIPISTGLVGGEIYFDIYGYKVYENTPNQVEGTVEDLRIKDVKITVVDSSGNEVGKTDLEYISKLNSNFSNEGQKVTTYQGTNVSEFPVQRGNIIVYNSNGAWTYATAFNREGKTEILEKLLLRSIKSNYGSANVNLSIDLPANNQLGYYTYTNYLSGKKLYPLSNKINLSENTSSLVLREVHKDEAIIV